MVDIIAKSSYEKEKRRLFDKTFNLIYFYKSTLALEQSVLKHC